MDSNPRYADARATKELSLGPCTCPGSPHVNGDTAVVRTEVGWGELKSAWGAGQMYHVDGSGYYDEAMGDATAIARFTRSWSLVDVDAKGRQEPRLISVAEVLRLDEATFAPLKAHFDALVEAKGRLPNGSSGQSVDSPRKTASRSPRTPRA
jgi:hypothetical protein